MAETIELIVSIILGVLMVISAVTGILFSVARKLKNDKLMYIAKTVNEIAESAKKKISDIKELYLNESKLLQKVEVEKVKEFIRVQCEDRGVKYDSEYWSEQIETIVTCLDKEEGDS